MLADFSLIIVVSVSWSASSSSDLPPQPQAVSSAAEKILVMNMTLFLSDSSFEIMIRTSVKSNSKKDIFGWGRIEEVLTELERVGLPPRLVLKHSQQLHLI